MPDEQIEVHVHDTVVFEKIYTSVFLKKGITDIRYRIMEKRSPDCFYYIKEESPSYKGQWHTVEVSQPFPSLKEVKMHLGYFLIGYDVCADKSEIRQLKRHTFRKDYKVIVKEKALKLGKKIGLFVFWVGYALYGLFAANFTRGGLDSLGIHQDHVLSDILGFPILIAIGAIPALCLFAGIKIWDRKKEGRL